VGGPEGRKGDQEWRAEGDESNTDYKEMGGEEEVGECEGKTREETWETR
jgi:hypothetical protein